ncbi:MAG: cupredoxin family copper-binding protein [Proteobacteria bacterium]|nr:cupredoxin family copper-binding protein [Pseudomonadota bacterium]
MKPVAVTTLVVVTALLSFAPAAAAPAAPSPVRGKPAPAGPVAVRISNFTFGPKTVTVKVGQTVTWTNDDDIPHTVVATDKSFRSKVIDTGQSFSLIFTRAGQFAYFCSLHPMMTGKVTVVAR